MSNKSKTVAIVLAVLFGPYSWLYTEKLENNNRMIISIILYSVSILFGLKFPIALFLAVPFWGWAIASQIMKADADFKNYDKIKKEKILGSLESFLTKNKLNKETTDISKDIIAYNSVKDINFLGYLFISFISLIVGIILGLIFKSWFIFWFTYIGPVILIILQKYTLKYKITKVEKERIENKVKFVEKKTANSKNKFDTFKGSKFYDLLSKFVSHLDLDMTPEFYWLAFKTVINDDDSEFLVCKKLLECEDSRGIDKFLVIYFNLLDGLKTLSSTFKAMHPNSTTIDLENYFSEHLSYSDYQEFDNFKALLHSKGFEFTDGEIVYLIIWEKTKKEHDKLEKYLLLNNAKTLNDYIYNFIQYNFNYGEVDIERFNLFLKKQKIHIDLNKLKVEVDTMKQKRKLESFEEKIIGSKFTTIRDVDLMSGYDFERFLVKLYQKMNYSVIKHTKLSNDQGADLVVEKAGVKYVIQAKRYVGTVGNDAIQQVTASIKYYNADKGVVITNSTFTTSAIKLASSNKIELIGRTELKKLIEDYL